MKLKKKLTASQLSALSLLSKGSADYLDLLKVGANGSTTSYLVSKYLAIRSDENMSWSITEAGRLALENGFIEVLR